MSREGNVNNHRKKLSLEKEEAVDPLFHLFTEIPLTSFERDREFFSKSIRDSDKSHQTSSQRSIISLIHYSSVGSYQFTDKKRNKNSLNSQLEQSNHLSKVQSNDRIKKFRINKICKNFIMKLRRNNIFSIPVSQQDLILSPKYSRKGIRVKQTFKQSWTFFAWIVIFFLFISQTLVITFSQLKDSKAIIIIINLGIMFIIGEIVLGLAQIKRKQGKEVENLGQIMKIYLKNQFSIDISVFTFLILILAQFTIVFNHIFVIVILLKLYSLQKRLQSFQNNIYRYSNMQKVCSITKIIIINIFIAHLIAILLNLMISSNPDDNWQITKGISDSWWFERYVWSLYWSVAIITTVGFGGIVPVSYSEAIWIIIIQIACCLLLAYNISYFYSNLANCTKKKNSKNKKILEKMILKKYISYDLKKKVKDYIAVKDQIDNQLNNQQQNTVIQALPEAFRKQITQQSIKNVIKYLPFFHSLHRKVINSLTQYFQKKIYLPNQIIKTFDDLNNIYILKKGEISYSCRSYRSKLNNYVTNIVKTSQEDKSHLLSLDFITRERQKYDIKSINCSIIFKLPLQCLRDHLLDSSSSLQFYCFIRDKSRSIIDEYETVRCKNCCNSKHTMVKCPKLHFIPIQQLIISKYIKKKAFSIQQRASRKVLTSRMMRRKLNTLKISKYCQEQYSKFSSFSMNRREQRKRAVIIAKDPSEAYWTNFISFQFSNQVNERKIMVLDEIWIVASDNIQHYKRYFPQGNLQSIIRKRYLAQLMRKANNI